MKKRCNRKPVGMPNFTAMDELMASPVAPVPESRLATHLLRLHTGLDALIGGEQVDFAAWRDMSDAVNILESLAEMGLVQDPEGQITAAKNAMGEAGARRLDGGPLQLSEEGAQVLRGLLTDYDAVVLALTERQFIQACRRTERRVRAILRGQVSSGDKVVAI